MHHIPEDVLDKARQLRAGGASWNAIAREVGFDDTVIRWRIDPEYCARQKAKHGGPSSMVRVAYFKPDEAEIRKIKDTVPHDTRTFTGRAMGDPLPGRSALDRAKFSTGEHVHKASLLLAERSHGVLMKDRHSNVKAV